MTEIAEPRSDDKLLVALWSGKVLGLRRATITRPPDIQEALAQGTVSRGRSQRVLRKKSLVIDDNQIRRAGGPRVRIRLPSTGDSPAN